MNISWKWLSTLVDLEGLTPEALSHMLTMAGLEIEGIHPHGSDPALDTVVVGHIESIEKHPDAEKLVVCQVKAGEHGTKQVVCGAKNMKAGDKVPIALPGTRLPGDFKIKKSKLRGVVSEGMLCAEDELGLGDDHGGLMILPSELETGASVFKALDLADTILEISVTPNRPDALSHIGVARDIAALTGRSSSWPRFAKNWRAEVRGESVPSVSVPWEGLATTGEGEPIDGQVKVEILDSEGCPRYGAALISGIKVGPSPDWMRRRLLAIGQRSINNIVDVTNYVLHECGQPLHAFDADKLAEGRIIVRRAIEGEKLTSLDGEERVLVSSDLVIADPKGPVAIAGVMGGLDSEVTSETTRVVIECAHFDPTSVRKTARRLKLHSESSHRFERGVDPGGVAHFIRRAIELIVATQEAMGHTPTVAQGIVDAHPKPTEARTVTLTAEHYSRVMGAAPGVDRMKTVLDALDLVSTQDGDALAVRVPSFRPDIERPVDLIEEIARIEGLGSLEATMPSGMMGFSHTEREGVEDLNATIVTVETERALAQAREALLGRGLYESVNYNFIASSNLALMGHADNDVRAHPIRLRNPLSEVLDVMRTSLLPGLLVNLRHNRSHRVSGANLFEAGRVYLRSDKAEAPVPDHVGGARWETHVEPMMIAAVLADPAWSHHTGSKDWDLHDVRALVASVVQSVSRQPFALEALGEGAQASVHPYATARVMVGGVEVGWFGTLHPAAVEAWSIEGTVHAFELDLSRLLALRVERPKMLGIPKYPAAQRDFALAVPVEMPFAEIEAALSSFYDKRLVGHRLFDVYTGEQIEAGRKSLAINVTFQDPKATLSDKVLTKLHNKLIAHLEKSLGAELR